MSSPTYSNDNPFASSSEARLYTAVSTSVPGGEGESGGVGGNNNATSANNPFNISSGGINEESRSLMDAVDGEAGVLSSPLTPPNPNRFSSFSPSIDNNSSANGGDSFRGSVVSESNSTQPISGAPVALAGAGLLGTQARLGSKEGRFAADSEPDSSLTSSAANLPIAKGGKSRLRRTWWVLAGVAGLLIVAAAVAIPVGLVFGRKDADSNKSSSTSGSGSGSGDNPAGTNNPPSVGLTMGGDGSTVTTENGTTFTYVNKFGGFWVDDPTDPFNDDAQPNSWTPPLNTSWRWGEDKIYGVNLGGLFVLEPFIAPSLFQKYMNSSGTFSVVDEWTLSQAMAADTSPGGGLGQIEDHYNTFITEEDIAEIAGAGLNWVRLPIPFWAIDKWDTPSTEEPFLARTCWTYILRVFRWCRKYGLRINLDLHTAPGSQNGFNHSGKNGQVNFLLNVMGFANAERMLGYIRIFTEFISQPEYQNLIPMFGIINEPLLSDIGKDVISHLYVCVYLQAYDSIRGITGIGEGNGPFISIHDGFLGTATWADFFPGSDRINLDTHPYFAFDGQPNTQPIDVWPGLACTSWAPGINTSQTAFGVTIAGEMSNAINDCGLYINGVQDTHSYGGDCSYWEDSTQWNQTIIDGLKLFSLASMDALQNWFFWTWKIGNSSLTNTMMSPLWSYKAGLEGGWVPSDPRSAVGVCASLGVTSPVFDGTYSAWQTGGSGAGTISPDVRSSFTAWPPATISSVTGAIEFVPTYTSTGTVSTLPPDSFTAAPKTLSVGDGWADASDTAEGVTEVAGCSYQSAWNSSGMTLPSTTCTGTAAARFARRTPAPAPSPTPTPTPTPTPAPSL